MENKESSEGAMKTPLSELKTAALQHYDEVSTKGNNWNNQVPQAIKQFYNEKIRKESPFQKELEQLINKFSQENASNTPDFILAEYLGNCLDNYNKTVAKRDNWHTADMEVVEPETVKASLDITKLQDNNGHWYWIPNDKVKDFNNDIEVMSALDYMESPERFDDFSEDYEQYRTGGDPDLMPDIFKSKS